MQNAVKSFLSHGGTLKNAVLQRFRFVNPAVRPLLFVWFESASSARIEENGFESTTIADVLKAKGKGADGSKLWCTTDDSVYDAVKLMTDKNIGALVVGKPGEQRSVAGIITERDTGEHMASLATAEACDSNLPLLANGELRVLQPVFQSYGQRRAFSGPIVTLKLFEDNVLVREMLETKGEGRVLVIDGGGSMRCALVGGNLGQLAQNNGWAGIVVNGCIRDVDEINGCDIGVRALASHPLKSNKKRIGEKHVPVYIAGAFIHDGEWLYADSDGILVSKSELCI